ncbi:MAG TPA: trehalose-phosphatase, partial [Burkholderiales bacterium]|nr:trehalose-phosphatase [Burkholderiales bacterium]
MPPQTIRLLSAGVDVERFFEALAAARSRILLLGFDGTLAPFHPRPERARPYPGLARLLDEISAGPRSRVIVVTGRSLQGPAPALGLQRPVELWGAHGWERLVPGAPLAVYAPSHAAGEALAAAQARAAPLRHRGARVERKPASVAVHWRGLPVLPREAVREALRRAWAGIVGTPELELVEFDGGVELRARGRSKGEVVERVLGEAGNEAAAAYLGDDLTDEDAFAAIE